jgi:hypothetical protein
LVNLEDCILYWMKSHGYHMFMQTLIPLAYRDLLSEWKWDTLTENSHFFRDICSNKLHTQYIKRLKTEYYPDNMQIWYDIPSIVLLLNRTSTHTFTVWGKT